MSFDPQKSREAHSQIGHLTAQTAASVLPQPGSPIRCDLRGSPQPTACRGETVGQHRPNIRKVSAERSREIAELRERGWSYGRIAMKFGLSAGAVHYHCLKQGAVTPNTRG